MRIKGRKLPLKIVAGYYTKARQHLGRYLVAHRQLPDPLMLQSSLSGAETSDGKRTAVAGFGSAQPALMAALGQL